MATPLQPRRRLLAAGAATAVVGSGLPRFLAAQDVMGRSAITGAGSTFVSPLIAAWYQELRQHQSGQSGPAIGGGGLDDTPTVPALDYEPVGSLAGLMRLRSGAVDFAVSEMPLGATDLASQRLVQFPLVTGGLAIIVNLPGIADSALTLNAAVLADIFAGRIGVWNDPAIVALNPDLKLPDSRIAPIHRIEGSGSTFNFTRWLSVASPAWRNEVGWDLSVVWLAGAPARGSQGMVWAVRDRSGAIGYVDYAQARAAGLAMARLVNPAGRPVRPEPGAFAAAAAALALDRPEALDLLLLDSPGPGSYPLVATAFGLMRRDASASRRRNALTLLDWALRQGQATASRLGYVPLPANIVAAVGAAWTRDLGWQAPLL